MKGITKEKQEKITKKAELLDMWESLNKLEEFSGVKNNLWFYHPEYFIEHLNRINIAAGKICTVPIREDFIPKTLTSKRPGTKLTPSFLTIHSTANSKSTAQNERDWLVNPGNDRKASWHIAVDEKEAIVAIPLDEVAYHAGCAEGNAQSFSIEICESGNRTKVLQNAIEVTVYYLREYNWGTTKLRTHNLWTGKDCPQILLNSEQRKNQTETWEWFVAEVGKKL